MKGEVDAMIVGKQSILFEENVYIEETACVAGQKESEGPLGNFLMWLWKMRWQEWKTGKKQKYLTATGCG